MYLRPHLFCPPPPHRHVEWPPGHAHQCAFLPSCPLALHRPWTPHLPIQSAACPLCPLPNLTCIAGAFFALAATHPKAKAAFFPVDEKGNIREDYRWDLSTLANVRGHWGLLMELLQNAVMQSFLRPKYSRDALLRWFAAVLNSNLGRAKTQVSAPRMHAPTVGGPPPPTKVTIV